MWDLQIAGISFFDVFYNFFIYSFFGWIYESTYVSIREKKWVNRGFLNGPVIPIYGSAATLLYIAFFNDRMLPVTQAGSISSMAVIYFTGLVLASVLEFVTSWTMEKIFHAKWWDYSECFMNIQGRVCLKASLFWGLLSVVMAEAIQPAMERLLAKFSRPLSEYIGYGILIVFLADFTITVIATLQLDKVLGSMERLREELYEAVEGRKWKELKAEFRERLEDSKAAEYLETLKENASRRSGEFKDKLENDKEEWKQKREAGREEQRQKREQFGEKLEERLESAKREREEQKRLREEKIKTFREQYQNRKKSRMQERIFKRLMTAYPNMKVKNRSGALRDLKENLFRKKK